MIIILIHLCCSYYFDFTEMEERKCIVFFIEPLDVITIKTRGETSFSKWENLDKLYLDITAITTNGEEIEYKTIDKNDYLSRINHKGQNNINSYIMKFSNQSPNSLSFALYLSPRYSRNDISGAYGEYEFYDVDDKYYREERDDLFIYFNPSSFFIIAFPLCGASLFLFYIFGCCSMFKEMKKYAVE